MVHISKARLSKATLDKLFYILFEALGRKRTQADFLSAVDTFLSPKERIQVAKRVAILFLLLQGIEQRTLARVVKVSTTTVNKYALLIERDTHIRELFSTLLRDVAILKGFLTLMNTLFPPGAPGHSWKVGWERKIELDNLKTTGL